MRLSRLVSPLLAALALGACFPENIQRYAGSSDPFGATDPSPDTRSLVQVVNDYRVAEGLPAIRVSRSLTIIAQKHVDDLERNAPANGVCILHSWSNKGPWTPCCYTEDNAQAGCMWNKPREITNDVYDSNGYEIAMGLRGGRATTQGALEAWRGSPAHLAVVLNQGPWANLKWRSVGAAISDHYAVVWFGEEEDPAGSP